MISSSHIDNKKKGILILGKGLTQGLERKLAAENLYSINLTKHNNKFGLSKQLSKQLVIINFKAKDSEISAYPLCLGNVSKDFSVDDMKKSGLKDYNHCFSVDYNGIAVANILDIRKYLMKKNEIV